MVRTEILQTVVRNSDAILNLAPASLNLPAGLKATVILI